MLFPLMTSFIPGDALAAQARIDQGGKKKLTYKDITRATLSQLYWRMGAFNTSNDIDIDNFMLLNRCDLYKENYRDDFEWYNIRNKAKASMEKNKANFPNRFQMTQQIFFERYNIRKEIFPLTHPLATSRFQIQTEKDWPCRDAVKTPRIWKYPDKANITFSSPLEIRTVRVLPKLAMLYNTYYDKVALHSSRPAYIRVRFKAYDAVPFSQKDLTRAAPAEISAVVEQIDFYADPNLTIHLATLNYRKRRKAKD